MSNIVNIPAEWNGEEISIEVEASTDRVVVSCDLLNLKGPFGELILVIDAELRRTDVGNSLADLWDAVKFAQEK